MRIKKKLRMELINMENNRIFENKLRCCAIVDRKVDHISVQEIICTKDSRYEPNKYVTDKFNNHNYLIYQEA